MFDTRLKEAAQLVEQNLAEIMNRLGNISVVHAMRYATTGGKRLRAFLVLESARLHEVPCEQAIWPATAIEAIHAYSLVHDDLPCMDDDALRRGLPAVHVRWDECTAVLAGDALHSLGFECVANAACHSNPAVRTELCLTLARAAGARGMVQGQALDIAAETAPNSLTLSEITHLQAGKTGALFSWSATAGAVMAQADTAPLRRYAEDLGLAFQIADDILDIEGNVEKLGKAVRKDADAGKATFVSLLGMEAAKSRARDLIENACDALTPYGNNAETLREAARFVISRDN
mgnify:CR=1 FL=1